MNDQQSYTRSEPFHQITMMNHAAFFDPRLLAASLNAQRHALKSQDDAQEVASFLLQLKHKSVTPDVQHSLDDPRLVARAAQAARLRELPLGYPAVGAVYGFPTGGFEHAHAYLERAPALLEEPLVSEMSWGSLLGDTELVLMKDRDLVPDALFVAMAQMKPCTLTQADRVGCYKSRDVGFTGMCCKHCAGQPGFGRYYPNSVRSLAQTTTSQTILKHIGGKCRFCPPQVRQAVLELQRQQAAKEGIAAGRPRYGSRKIFFQRMWARLHGKPFSEEDEEIDDELDSKGAEEASHDIASEEEHTGAGSTDQESEDESIDLSQSHGAKRKRSSDERETKRPRVVGL
jgi:hypothetical protein